MRTEDLSVQAPQYQYTRLARHLGLIAAGACLFLICSCTPNENSILPEAQGISSQSNNPTDTILFQGEEYYVTPSIQVGASFQNGFITVNGASVVVVDSAFALLNSRSVILYVPAAQENTVYLREVFLDLNTIDNIVVGELQVFNDENLNRALLNNTPIFPPKDNTPPPTTKSMGIEWKH